MTTLQSPKLFGVIQIPSPSTDENTATYIVTREVLANIPLGIVAYYTFPGLEEYLELPSAVRNVRNENYLPNIVDK